jgi:hypothetical protein
MITWLKNRRRRKCDARERRMFEVLYVVGKPMSAVLLGEWSGVGPGRLHIILARWEVAGLVVWDASARRYRLSDDGRAQAPRFGIRP